MFWLVDSNLISPSVKISICRKLSFTVVSYLFICLLFYMFTCLLVYLFVYIFIYLFIWLFIYLFIYLFAYNSAERPVDWKSKFFKIKLYYFEGSLSLWYNIILKLLSVSYIFKLDNVYWNNKIKCIDEMHYACIVSVVESSHWKMFLENRCS